MIAPARQHQTSPAGALASIQTLLRMWQCNRWTHGCSLTASVGTLRYPKQCVTSQYAVQPRQCMRRHLHHDHDDDDAASAADTFSDDEWATLPVSASLLHGGDLALAHSEAGETSAAGEAGHGQAPLVYMKVRASWGRQWCGSLAIRLLLQAGQTPPLLAWVQLHAVVALSEADRTGL
jgi:hypothetical protein